MNVRNPLISSICWATTLLAAGCASKPTIPAIDASTRFEDLKGLLMAKVKTNGNDADEVWKRLKAAFPGDVRWNFAAMFVVGPDGAPVGRFSAKELPQAYAALNTLLGEAA